MSPASWNLTQICMISDDGNRQLRCSRSHNVRKSLLANETGFGAASSNREIENAVSSLYGWFLATVQTGDYCFWIDSDVHVRRWCIAPAMFFHRKSFSCKFPPNIAQCQCSWAFVQATAVHQAYCMPLQFDCRTTGKKERVSTCLLDSWTQTIDKAITGSKPQIFAHVCAGEKHMTQGWEEWGWRLPRPTNARSAPGDRYN